MWRVTLKERIWKPRSKAAGTSLNCAGNRKAFDSSLLCFHVGRLIQGDQEVLFQEAVIALSLVDNFHPSRDLFELLIKDKDAWPALYNKVWRKKSWPKLAHQMPRLERLVELLRKPDGETALKTLLTSASFGLVYGPAEEVTRALSSLSGKQPLYCHLCTSCLLVFHCMRRSLSVYVRMCM